MTRKSVNIPQTLRKEELVARVWTAAKCNLESNIGHRRENEAYLDTAAATRGSRATTERDKLKRYIQAQVVSISAVYYWSCGRLYPCEPQ